MHAIILHRDAKIEICVDTVVENRRKKSHFTKLQAKRTKFVLKNNPIKKTLRIVKNSARQLIW